MGSDYNVHDGGMLQYHSPNQTWLCELAPPRADMSVVLEVDIDCGTLTLLNHHSSAISTNDYCVGQASAQRQSLPQGTAGATASQQVLARPGMQDRHQMLSGTGPTHPLKPPLRWAAQVGYGTQVRVSNPSHHAAYGSGNAKTKGTTVPVSEHSTALDGGTSLGRASTALIACAGRMSGVVNIAPVSITSLPLLVLALICSCLSAHDLCRIACVSRRFTEPLSPKPTAACGSIVLRSVIQEGARLAALRHPTALFGRGEDGVGAIFAQDLGVELKKGKKAVFAHPERDIAWVALLWQLECRQ